MKARFTVALALSAGLMLSACGGQAASTSSASTSSASASSPSASSTSIKRLAQPPSGSTSLCIQNIWSAITPSVQFSSQGTLVVSDDGPLRFGATACATGSDTKSAHLEGWVTLPEPYASYRFAADTPYLMSMFENPTARLWPNTQVAGIPFQICIKGDGYSVGDRRTWDDGLLRFVMVREPDFGGTVFRLTIDRSQKPSADGKPALCSP